MLSCSAPARRAASPSRRLLFPVLVVLVCVAAAPAFAQKKKESRLKTVHGTVVDRADNPVPSSVVYLKNVRSLDVKTYISDSGGMYRFSGLDPNVDYEIHAVHGTTCSPNRTVSSFDSRKDIEIVLKLSRTNCRQ
jgi:Carboxypeptidase regulatory-like domain